MILFNFEGLEKEPQRKSVTETQRAWGYSSAGRAPALQAGGQEFDSPYLHHPIFRTFLKEKVQKYRIQQKLNMGS